MAQADRALQAAFHPLTKTPAPFTAGSVAAVAAQLLPDATDANVVRRVVITNTHATQDLALFTVEAGGAIGAPLVTTAGGFVVLARTSREILIGGNRRISIVGSGAATTYNGFADDL